MDKNGRSVACRNRDKAKDRQSLVMGKKAGGRAGWKAGGEPREWSQVGFYKIHARALNITSVGLGPSGKSLLLPSLGLSFPT